VAVRGEKMKIEELQNTLAERRKDLNGLKHSIGCFITTIEYLRRINEPGVADTVRNGLVRLENLRVNLESDIFQLEAQLRRMELK